MADTDIFYAIDASSVGTSIAAKFLQVDGAFIVDPNFSRSTPISGRPPGPQRMAGPF